LAAPQNVKTGNAAGSDLSGEIHSHDKKDVIAARLIRAQLVKEVIYYRKKWAVG